MKQELQEQIFQKYPTIFQNRTLPMSQTCMCWGLTCGDGWYYILEDLCRNLAKIEKEYDVKITAEQVKEKFGTLRFYYDVEFGPKWTVKKNLFFELFNRLNEYNMPKFIGKYIGKIKTSYNKRKHYFDGKNKIGWHRVFRSCDSNWMFAREGIVELISDHVAYTEHMSCFVCEHCGVTSAKIRDGGWLLTLCDKCQEFRNTSNQIEQS